MARKKSFTVGGRVWRCFGIGLTATMVMPLMLHQFLEDGRKISWRLQLDRQEQQPDDDNQKIIDMIDSQEKKEQDTNDNGKLKIMLRQKILSVAETTEKEILRFFHNEPRSISDGVQMHHNHSIFARHLSRKIHRCHENPLNTKDCTLRVVFVGSAQMSGRDNFYNQTFPFASERTLQNLATASGLALQFINHAMDNDLGREGPQTCHMCLANLVGDAQQDPVDVIVWGFDDCMKAGRPAQFEAFVRWAASMHHPAMIVVHRDGPHTHSRRGAPRNVLMISPGHTAIVYEDQTKDELPEPQSEPYQGSKPYRHRWEDQNKFLHQMFDRYNAHVDFAAIDPVGALWYIDHLEDFSNQALVAEKVLPLLDCGYPGHPPPCNEIPEFVHNHANSANISIESLPKDSTGALCGGKWGCRHNWYGGTHSHEFQGKLNAMVFVKSFLAAAEYLVDDRMDWDQNDNQVGLLPKVEHCSKKLCGKIPHCITSYEPNLGPKLRDHLILPNNSSTHGNGPRMGAAHFANNPEFQVNDLEKRVAPLGYQDRKYGYLLAVGKDDVSNLQIEIQSPSGGPVVLCEPPCFSDECPKKRKMPFEDYITSIKMDGTDVVRTDRKTKPPEVGKYCFMLVESLSSSGKHILEIGTNVSAPDFIMVSHVVLF